MSDDYNVYSLRNHTVISPVNPNESPPLVFEGQASEVQEGNQGGQQEPGDGQVLTSVGPVGEKANTGIYIISVDTMDTLNKSGGGTIFSYSLGRPSYSFDTLRA